MIKPDVRGFFDRATATWTYIVYNSNGADRHCAVIDSVLDYDAAQESTSTTSADKVIAFIKERDLTVQWVLETHIHADHLTASSYLKEKLGGTTGISKHIVDVLKTWAPRLANAADTPQDGKQFDRLFEDNERFLIGEMEAKIIHTLGHTPADTSYIIGDAVFVGDTMFLPDVGSGRCDFPGGDPADSYDSAQKLLALPDDFRMYVGHDYPTQKRVPQCMATIAEQRANNIRFKSGISKESFIAQRMQLDTGKNPPALLIPSLRTNLKAGKI